MPTTRSAGWCWLKDHKPVELPKVLALRTGVNRWEHYDSWPPKTGIKEVKLYLQARGALAFQSPARDRLCRGMVAGVGILDLAGVVSHRLRFHHTPPSA
jgi:hypothetical protein